MSDVTPSIDAELEVLRAVTNDLALAVRMGGLAGDPVTLAFVWAQNKDELLRGRTTWEAQWGPHRRLARNGSSGGRE